MQNAIGLAASGAYFSAMGGFDRTDYSVVVKRRNKPPNTWRWEIHRAGKSYPIKLSSVHFRTMAAANRAGKEALKQLLNKLFS